MQLGSHAGGGEYNVGERGEGALEEKGNFFMHLSLILDSRLYQSIEDKINSLNSGNNDVLYVGDAEEMKMNYEVTNGEREREK